MVIAVPQRILLICLLHFCTCAVGQTMSRITLMNIVRNFENQLGSLGQYAVAFRVEKNRCQDSSYSGQELITQQVKETLQLSGVYVSDTLIAAAPHEEEHSEYRLKNFLKDILNAQDECVVFFTVNSPCVKTCLAESGPYSVKDSLVLLNKYAGIKAFAFKKIWKYDKKKKVIRRLKGIASALPYYQCERNKATCDRL